MGCDQIVREQTRGRSLRPRAKRSADYTRRSVENGHFVSLAGGDGDCKP
jgi:hypothetical protein